jgi:exodeoxyribonuclease VII small subunit
MNTDKSKSTKSGVDRAPLTFEKALSELEATVEALEKPDLTLDTSLDLFEKGVTLIRTCDTHLKKAQGRVQELLQGENGEFVEKIIGPTLETFLSHNQTAHE